jgi:hypothetical protein
MDRQAIEAALTDIEAAQDAQELEARAKAHGLGAVSLVNWTDAQLQRLLVALGRVRG